MPSFRFPTLALALVLALPAAPAQAAPTALNYQGRIIESNQNPTGDRQFKFALVTTTPAAATLWSHDGTGLGTPGSAPTSSLTLPVKAGRFDVRLGDTTVAGMTSPVTASIFTGRNDVRLRIWVRDPAAGGSFAQLSPDQTIGSEPAAVLAGSVRDGGVTTAALADGAVQTGNLATGSVTGTALAPGAGMASLTASGATLVPAGGVVMAREPNSTTLLSSGYSLSGSLDLSPDTWTQKTTSATANAPSARAAHSTVWTGSELIVFGGTSGTPTNTGARYNPATNTWTALPSTGAPAARYYHSAIWTGADMIIFGGTTGPASFADGARYSPVTNTWTALPATTLAGRHYHAAVWTGTEMIIHGGWNGSTYFADGARYNAAADSWTLLPTTGAPAARAAASSAWTGSEFLTWGGSGGTALANGARFSPATGNWTALPATGAPAARWHAATAWTGTELFIWGGYNLSTFPIDGARFNPTTSTWTALPAASAPTARQHTTATWTGNAVIVHGGTPTPGNNPAGLATGAYFFPSTNSWEPLTAAPSAHAARSDHTASWTGTDLLIFGGWNVSGPVSDGLWSFTPKNKMFLYKR